MAVSLTVNGVAKELKRGTLRISQHANDRGTASFTLESPDGSYRPPPDAPIVIQENSVTLYGGVMERPRERGLFQGAPNASIGTSLSAVDFNVYAEWRIVITTIPAGTLKAALTQLISEYLDEFGVTLHGSQVDGPTLPYLEYGGRYLNEVLNDLATRTASDGQLFVWRIDENKVLRMFQPSTAAAPFDITGDTPSQVIGDIEVEETRERYRNKVTGRIPATNTVPDIFVYASDTGEIATYKTRDLFLYFDDNPSEATAQLRVNDELAKCLAVRKTVKYATLTSGLVVGQSQTINVPRRNVNATGVITQIDTSDYGKESLHRVVTVTIDDSQTNIGRDWRHVVRVWSGDKTGGARAGAVTGETGVAPTAPGPPDQSIQSNQGGLFSGKDTFTFKRANNSVVLGLNSAITAVAYDSCMIIGDNCRIADP